MAHFAKIDSNGIVENVIVAEQEFVDAQEGTWIQTSYNTVRGVHTGGGTPLRWNFASIGDFYNSETDEFIDPQPFDSWVLDASTRTWNPPLTKPDGDYYWDEQTYLDDNTQGWIEIT